MQIQMVTQLLCKGGMFSKVTLVEKDKTIHKDKEIAEAMNKCFFNITKNLRLKRSKKCNTTDIDIDILF